METLGDEAVVVGQGRQLKNFVPLNSFLRRNPNLAAIQTAIAETVTSGTALASITPKTKRVIRTEPVTMTDGRIHGVHVWCGAVDAEPPERPIPGAWKWDVTTGEVFPTTEYFHNSGMDPATEPLAGRAFADDIPSRSLNTDESKALSLAIDIRPGRTYGASWEYTDKQGLYRKVGWCSRSLMEMTEDGTEHLIARAMNIVESVSDSPPAQDRLADLIVSGLSQPGVHRLLVDLTHWTAVKWIDDPCPYFNWRGRVRIHPDDAARFTSRMRDELNAGMTAAVLRLPGNDGEWVPLHVSITKVELDDGVFAGLVSLRQPTADELADAGLAPIGDSGTPR